MRLQPAILDKQSGKIFAHNSCILHCDVMDYFGELSKEIGVDGDLDSLIYELGFVDTNKPKVFLSREEAWEVTKNKLAGEAAIAGFLLSEDLLEAL